MRHLQFPQSLSVKIPPFIREIRGKAVPKSTGATHEALSSRPRRAYIRTYDRHRHDRLAAPRPARVAALARAPLDARHRESRVSWLAPALMATAYVALGAAVKSGATRGTDR